MKNKISLATFKFNLNTSFSPDIVYLNTNN